jgi:hypothetical protein
MRCSFARSDPFDAANTMLGPALAVAALASVLAACAAPDRQAAAEDDFARYRALPNYRAMAVTGEALDAASYASGWSSAATSIDGAIEVALHECDTRRDPSSQPPCALYAIGDLVVAGADANRLAQAKCVYILSPAAASLADSYAAACAAAACAAAASRARRPAMAADGGGASGAPAAVTLGTVEIASRLVGNTLATTDDSAFIYLGPGGRAVMRTADPAVGSDTGQWRLAADSELCLRWQRVGAGQELCHPVRQAGGTSYEVGDLRVAVIDGNAFGL